MPQSIALPGVEILAPVSESYAEILTPDAVAFIVDLQRTFNARRKAAAGRASRAPEAARCRREARLP